MFFCSVGGEGDEEGVLVWLPAGCVIRYIGYLGLVNKFGSWIRVGVQFSCSFGLDHGMKGLTWMRALACWYGRVPLPLFFFFFDFFFFLAFLFVFFDFGFSIFFG